MPGISSYLSDERGAVAATYAIAITGLIIVAGAAFDYNRVMTLDSELQNAADNAALAGVTQLDDRAGACARAANAAIELVNNITLLSNDGGGNAVTINGGNTVPVTEDACDPSSYGNLIYFYQDRDRTPATTDSDAGFIEVFVDKRNARFAFTAIGDLFEEDAGGIAFAGIGSAICRVPPLKICNPVEPLGNTDLFLDFPVESSVGSGIKLLGNQTDVPGAFGFLQTEFGSGANGLLAALGWDVRGGDCVSVDGVEIQDGVVASARDGINVRFDMPGSGNGCPNINGVTGKCSPSINSRKDRVRLADSDTWQSFLGSSPSNAHLASYRPSSAATYDTLYPAGTTPALMGHPRDLCHAWSLDGNCTSGLLGTGDWDIQAYWRSNYGTAYANDVDATIYGAQPKGYPTRYQVYRWEADQLLAGTLPGGNSKLVGFAKNGKGLYSYAQPQPGRAAALPASPYGLVPGSQLDRRRLSVAMLNCNALQAKYGNSLNNKVLEVGNWLDIFLVEPAEQRSRCSGGSGCGRITEQFDVYVELIGRTDIGGSNGTNLQTVRRDVPYLIE